MSSQKTRFMTLISLMTIAVLSFTLPALARGGDATGPVGQGAMTGRGAGYCAGYSVPGYMNTGVARGGFWGTGARGGGRGNRNIYMATGLTRWQRAATAQAAAPIQNVAPAQPVLSKEQRLQALKTQADILKKQLENLTTQIKAVESSED